MPASPAGASSAGLALGVAHLLGLRSAAWAGEALAIAVTAGIEAYAVLLEEGA